MAYGVNHDPLWIFLVDLVDVKARIETSSGTTSSGTNSGKLETEQVADPAATSALETEPAAASLLTISRHFREAAIKLPIRRNLALDVVEVLDRNRLYFDGSRRLKAYCHGLTKTRRISKRCTW
jgi:hypothetical protein